MTRASNFRYHLFEGGSPGGPTFWCSSFDGLVGSTLSDRPSASGRTWGFYCRNGYEMSEDDVEELLQSLTLHR